MNLLSRFGGRLWDPWREIGQLQHEMGRLINSARPFPGTEGRQSPAVNVYVNENDILITLEVPGIDPSQVEITVTGSTISLKGNREAERVGAETSFHRRERSAGEFHRNLQLPFEVDAARTEATFDKGVLTIRLTRPESSKPRKISVKTA